MDISFKRLNHIQICIPTKKEEEAKKFYCGLLGLEEIEKPEFLKKNGGFWLKIADIELHIGTEEFINKSKRHPAFEVEKLNSLKKYLETKGIRIKDDKSLPLFNRFSFFDPFNNRIELLESKSNEELQFLGKKVTVKIDRAIKSKHPKFDFEYELNYGFIPGTLSGDGQELDAYVLGIEEPIEEFTGIVKAVVLRYNDNENKLIVANQDLPLNEKQIEEAIYFQEKYFETEIKMMEAK